jgi:hypothetical protein
MKTIRPLAALATAGFAALLSGCVVAPIGRPVTYYPARPVYVEPAPVVVVPAPGYYGYRGYYGNRGYYGGRHWRY